MSIQTVETAESVSKHDASRHKLPWSGKTKDWYDNVGGGTCPACGHKPEYEEVETSSFSVGGGLKVKGLSSGERLR